jgi:TPR repeat protein
MIQKAKILFNKGDRKGYFLAIQRAASMGSLLAQHRLGLCYARGLGIAQNTEKAVEIMREAAERGHIGAKSHLARRQLARPLNPIGFFAGLIQLLIAFVQGLVILLRNPHDDRVR